MNNFYEQGERVKDMELGKELNAFKDWLLKNDLPSSAVVLYYTLMNLRQGVGKKQFNAPSRIVEHLTGLSKQGVSKARAKLVENKLIHYQPGKIGMAPVYEIVSLIDQVERSVDPSVDQTGYQQDRKMEDQLEKSPQSVDQSEPKAAFGDQLDDSLLVEKVTVLKGEEEKRRRGGHNEDPFVMYENNFGILKPILRDSLAAWCEDLGDGLVMEAMKLTVQMGGKTFSYLETILREWAGAGLETIEQVKTYQQEKQSKSKVHTVPFRKQTPTRNKSLFDELRRELGS